METLFYGKQRSDSSRSMARDCARAQVLKRQLPAPAAPMFAVLRLYLPRPEVLSGAWTQPRAEEDAPKYHPHSPTSSR